MRQLYNYYKYGLGLIFFIVLLWVWKTSVVVQLLSHVQLFATLCTAAHQASLSFTISWSLLKFMSTELVMIILSSTGADLTQETGTQFNHRTLKTKPAYPMPNVNMTTFLHFLLFFPSEAQEGLSEIPFQSKGYSLCIIWACVVHYWVTLNIHWKDWCWSWSFNTLATWGGELSHLGLSCVWLLVTPWTAALQDPLSMAFSKQGYWSG